MNITVVQGVRAWGTLSNETRLVRDVEDMLQELEPSEGPLTQILSRLQIDTATDGVKIEWFEDQLLPDFDVLSVALAAADATMTVTNFAYFRADDIVQVNDYEQVRVTATPTTTTVAITRAFGTIPAAAAAVGARLKIVSDATLENAGARDVITTQKVPRYNYLQQLGSPASWSDLDLASNTFAGKEMVNEHKKAIIEHKKKMEKQFLTGQPYAAATGTRYRCTTGGLEYFIQSNIKDCSGGFTEPEFEDFLRICFRYGASKQKLVFCSPKAIQSINGFARSKLQTFCDDNTYGVTITEYRNAGRQVGLIEEVLMTNASLNDLTGLAGHLILVDPANIKMSYLQGQSTHIAENIQAPDIRGRLDEVRCTFAFKAKLEQTMGICTGIAD
jgi:hypothetical protein